MEKEVSSAQVVGVAAVACAAVAGLAIGIIAICKSRKNNTNETKYINLK